MSVLRLSEASGRWVASFCPNYERTDLKIAYSFEHPLNVARELRRDQLCPNADDPDFVRWMLMFRNAAGEETIDILSREVYAVMPLSARSGRGPIAFNRAFYVKDEFKGQKLARRVYAQEEELYRKWGLCQIQLKAVDDGLVRWIKDFGFIPKNANLLATEYLDWAPRHGLKPEVPSSPKDYPDHFLRERTHLDLYKDLAR